MAHWPNLVCHYGVNKVLSKQSCSFIYILPIVELSCWQLQTEGLFPGWLSPGGHSQLLEASCIPLVLAPLAPAKVKEGSFSCFSISCLFFCSISLISSRKISLPLGAQEIRCDPVGSSRNHPQSYLQSSFC